MYKHYTFPQEAIALMSVSDDSSVTLVKMLPTSFMCFTVSLLDSDTFMVSTFNHEQPVQTVDVHGNEGDFQHKLLPNKTYKIDESACTYIPSRNTCVFVDRDQHTVYMCDITSGEGRVIKREKIVKPGRVHAGPNGTVFVCSYDTHTLQRFYLDKRQHYIEARLNNIFRYGVFKLFMCSDNFSFQNNGIKKCTCWKTMGFLGKQWVFLENNVF